MTKETWLVYNDALNKAWTDYSKNSQLIGKSMSFPEKKFFGLKIKQVEKVLSDTWIECSYSLVDKNNVASHFKNLRIRDFEEYSDLLDRIKDSLSIKGNVIRDFSVSCEKEYITPFH